MRLQKYQFKTDECIQCKKVIFDWEMMLLLYKFKLLTQAYDGESEEDVVEAADLCIFYKKKFDS